MDEMNRPRPRRRVKNTIKMILCLMVGVLVGSTIRLSSRPILPVASPGVSSSSNKFDMVYDTISSYWLDVKNSDKALEDRAIIGFLNELDDPYTVYFTQEELSDFTESVDGSFAGIGVTFSMMESGALVSKVLHNTPAEEVGLMVGDIITQVNDTKLEGLESTDVKALIVGAENSAITLQVLRGTKILSFTPIRRIIDTTVYYDIRELDGEDFAYLQINSFGELTDQSVLKALNVFKSDNIQNIVIDLRDNGGGYLSSVQKTLSYFTLDKTVLFKTQSKGNVVENIMCNAPEYFSFIHGYILVNSNTASAAEVMAGSLRELVNYKLIGKLTYGKGVAQRQAMLSDMTSIKYTYAQWLLPISDGCIDGVGLTPDIVVDVPEITDFYNINLEDGETLGYDQVDDRIIFMQQMLSLLGFEPGREDGYFSSQTKDALMAFEMNNGLEADGIYTSEDNDMLISRVVAYFSLLENDAAYQAALEQLRG